MAEEIVHSRCAAEFAAIDGGERVGVLRYTVENGTMNIFHTFVEPDRRGQGIASRMTDAARAFAEREGLKVVASCSYAAAKLE